MASFCLGDWFMIFFCWNQVQSNSNKDNQLKVTSRFVAFEVIVNKRTRGKRFLILKNAYKLHLAIRR